MNHLLVALLIALAVISFRSDKAPNPSAIRMAWIWFACIPFTHVVTTLFRAGNYRNPYDIALVEIWSDGFQWLFLGLSIVSLANVFTFPPVSSSTPRVSSSPPANP
jgi:hypothetical protein